MSLYNLYNFKNPIRYFFNLENVYFPEDIEAFSIDSLDWTEPIRFRVKKQNDTFRTLKIPNVLNFVAAYHHFKSFSCFDNVQAMDPIHKRMSTNLETGDFITGEYDRQLENDFENLCIYDNLVKLDIKEYYGRIYTHKIGFSTEDERYLTNMNAGATNGLIMGNYLSLYAAEKNSNNIAKELEEKISAASLNCRFSYFSDDFYFFCNANDNEHIIKIFDIVLEQNELERSEKKEIWTYETFNNFNILARNWKKLTAYCNLHFKAEKDDNKLYLINQIVYRMMRFNDDKLKRVFVNNIFKTNFFQEMPLEKFQVKNYDYHQFCFLMKFSPEALLYTSNKFANMQNFDNSRIKDFFNARYIETLKSIFNEEQLYYYYAIKIFGFEDILKNNSSLVCQSHNQVLISYYLKDNLFNVEELEILRSSVEESTWFQNYHLILYSVDLQEKLAENIEKYLIPSRLKSNGTPQKKIITERKQVYLNFYEKNISEKTSFIQDIDTVQTQISQYLNLKFEEGKSKKEEQASSLSKK